MALLDPDRMLFKKLALNNLGTIDFSCAVSGLSQVCVGSAFGRKKRALDPGRDGSETRPEVIFHRQDMLRMLHPTICRVVNAS